MLYGLIGKSLSHSFSQYYFTQKFEKENIDAAYQLFEIPQIQDFLSLKIKYPDLKGLNVTIPYKKEIIPLLDEISEQAMEVGAVNTIKFLPNGKTKGYNTDIDGFYETLIAFIPKELQLTPLNVLILGTGGASLAVEYVIKMYYPLWKYSFASRSNPSNNQLLYEDISLSDVQLIINTTPLGMYPAVGTYPDIPYKQITEKHYVMDLVYNPLVTTFLKKAKFRNAHTCNGLKMLHIQAEKAYDIWCM